MKRPVRVYTHYMQALGIYLLIKPMYITYLSLSLSLFIYSLLHFPFLSYYQNLIKALKNRNLYLYSNDKVSVRNLEVSKSLVYSYEYTVSKIEDNRFILLFLFTSMR